MRLAICLNDRSSTSTIFAIAKPAISEINRKLTVPVHVELQHCSYFNTVLFSLLPPTWLAHRTRTTDAGRARFKSVSSHTENMKNNTRSLSSLVISNGWVQEKA